MSNARPARTCRRWQATAIRPHDHSGAELSPNLVKAGTARFGELRHRWDFRQPTRRSVHPRKGCLIAQKWRHEIRDPVHDFIRMTDHERKIVNSRPIQRLRHIHQLAMTYMVYPGATHRRFEHSLGVMELAGRVFDVITRQENLTDEVRELVPEVTDIENLSYWRTVVRVAALCHDIGHLPFSHAAEHELLPEGWSHESLSEDILLADEMAGILRDMTPPIDPSQVAKIAVGRGKTRGDRNFSNWEAILSEIIVGDSFGVDRMDYLLRDSHHAGVKYGQFDHHRLIDTLRILPSPPVGDEHESGEPELGIQEGGIHAAEALLLARYFMFTQVYFHRVRVAYDVHLADFLGEWLDGGKFSTDVEEHLSVTDNEVLEAIRDAATRESQPSDSARRILRRDHFRVLYQRHPEDLDLHLDPGLAIYEAAVEQYGTDVVRHKSRGTSGGDVVFPVQAHDGRVGSSTSHSNALRLVPPVAMDYVLVDEGIAEEARNWLSQGRDSILRDAAAEDAEEEEPS